jgi:hypothetical protein
MALVGQTCAQAVTTSPSANSRPSDLALSSREQQALEAKGAFFHDTPTTNSDIGVEHIR